MIVRPNFLTALAVIGLSIPLTSTDATADAVEQHIREMLDKAWGDKAAELTVAQELFEQASKLHPDDPRLHHAYGLVLLKHHRYGDAQKQFEAAAKQGASPYLPAWRLLIQLRVMRGEHEAALAELDGWAQAVAALKPGTPEERLQQEYVAWTGRIMGYLEKPAASKRIEVRRRELDAKISSVLDVEHRQLYADNKADVLKQYDEIIGLRDQRRAVAKKQEEKEKAERKAEIATETTQLAGEQDKLEMTAAQWQDWIDRQLAECDRQLSSLERDFNRLENRARPLAFSIADLEQEIDDLRVQRDRALRDDEPRTTPRIRSSDKKPDVKPASAATPKTTESKTPPKPTEPKPGDPKPKEKPKVKSDDKPKTKTTPGSSDPDKPRAGSDAKALAVIMAVALAAAPAHDPELAASYQRSIDRLTFEVSILRREYAELDQEAAEVKAAARAVLGQRQVAIAQYQRATGQLVKKSESLKAWEKRLAAEAKSAAEPATGKTARDRAIGTTAASLSTYVPMNLDHEKQRLLESLGKP
jgi:hypothetical protein